MEPDIKVQFGVDSERENREIKEKILLFRNSIKTIGIECVFLIDMIQRSFLCKQKRKCIYCACTRSRNIQTMYKRK